MAKIPVNQKRNEQRRIIFGAFLGTSVVATIQLISIQSLDLPLTFSVYCFAVSIPLLTLGLYTAMIESREQFTVESRPVLYAEELGVLAAAGGILALFLHFSYPALVLVLAIGIALVLGGYFDEKLAKANENEAENK